MFLFLGVAIAAGGAYPIYDYQQTVDRAEPVDGEIESSDWERNYEPSEEGKDYSVSIEYRFTYEGTEYTSNEVFPDGRNGELSMSRAQTVAGNHPEGEEVTAYVVDGDPRDTYLVQNGIPWWYYPIAGFGLLLASLGGFNVVQGIRGVGPMTSDD